MRWSRNHPAEDSGPVPPTDPELNERLDDELRNLD
jgi:hypothetical protein